MTSDSGTSGADREPAAHPETDVTSTLSLPGLAEPEEGAPAEASVVPTEEPLAPGTALLVVQRGPNAGSRFVLEADVITGGRHPDSDIFLDDVTVSRRHAQFVRVPEGYRVKDVGSLNGTYVNRHRIDDVLLHTGDEVQVGKFRLVYFAGPTPVGAEPAQAPGGDG
ncbi:MAG TPA: FHA domain-containing protein [Actinomycetes bacterium]